MSPESGPSLERELALLRATPDSSIADEAERELHRRRKTAIKRSIKNDTRDGDCRISASAAAGSPSGSSSSAASASTAGPARSWRIALLERELAAAQAAARAAQAAAEVFEAELRRAQLEAATQLRQAQQQEAARPLHQPPQKECQASRTKDPTLTLFSGVVAGCIEATATWPLEYIKTQMQATRKVVITGGRIPGGVSLPQPYTTCPA
jgi:hypothetical protein